MAESYSVKAILSAQDRGFSSTLKSCASTLDKIDSKISGFSFGVLTGAGQAAFGALKNGVSGLITEINSSNAAWKTFEGNMSILGKGTKEIDNATKELQKYAQQTVYSSSDMASTYAQLEAVGTKSTLELVKGFGGLAAASENPQQAMKTLSTQATQMAAKPSVAWADFKLMLEQTPAGIAAVAKEMGMSTSEMVTAVQDGEIATDKFFEAIIKAGGAGTEFEKLATTPKTVGQAMDGLTETLGNKLMPAFDMISQKGIGLIEKLSTSLGNISAEDVAAKVSAAFDRMGNAISKVKTYWNAAVEAFSGVGSSIKTAVDAVKSSFNEMTGGFGSTSDIDNFKGVMEGVADVIKRVAAFATEHSAAIAKLIKWLPAIAIGIKGFKVARTVAPFITTFAGGVAKIASSVGGGIASKLFGLSKGQKEVGKTSAATGAQMWSTAKSFLALGAGVLLVAVGFGIMAQASIALANAGGGAIAVMGGMVLALVGLGVGMALLLKTLAPLSASLIPVGVAFLALGAAVLLIAVGFALMAQASIALASAGAGAILVMVGMVAAIALLAVGAALLGAALTAGAVGFVAFGAAVLLVGAGFALLGVGAMLAATALQMIVTVLPMLCAYGMQGALAIGALGLAMTVFAVGAGLAGAACIVLGAGLLVCAAAALVFSAAVVILAAGILLASAGLAIITALLPSLAANGTAGAAAITAVGVAMLALGAGSLVAGAGLIVLGGGFAVATLAAAAFGIAAAAAAIGTLALSLALKGVKSSMKSIASNAKTAQKSLKSMNKSVDAVTSGLDAVGNKAKSAMKKLTSAFDDTESKAKKAGKAVGTGFTSGMQSGLSQASSVAMSMSAQVGSALSAGRSSAYSAGAYISIGFAQGMLSQLAIVRSAATQLAAQADKAVRAKAKIKSPSRVSRSDGQYWGEGLGLGILDMASYVWKAAQELVSIPNIATPNLAYAYSGAMSSEYEYSRNSQYTIEVPVVMDGREVAKVSADYMEAELDKRQTRANRKNGKA